MITLAKALLLHNERVFHQAACLLSRAFWIMQPAIFRNQLLTKLSAKQAAEKTNKPKQQDRLSKLDNVLILTNLLKMRVGQHPGKVASVSSLFGFATKTCIRFEGKNTQVWREVLDWQIDFF